MTEHRICVLDAMTEDAGEDGCNLRNFIVGLDNQVPLLNGEITTYVNFDNAASTPSLKSALNAVCSFQEWYSSVHRGAGFKSRLASAVYDSCRDIVADFVGADLSRDAIIFCSGTTDAINRLACHYPMESGGKIAISHMEHHANDLPWRRFQNPIRIPVSDEGTIDPQDLKDTLERHGGDIKLFSVTGASNVVGTLVPIHELATICHEYGAKIMVDAAQLVPHCRVDMKPLDDPGHIDFLAFSAHKMYAPYGAGVLIAPQEFLEQGDPAIWGGGAVAVVSEDEVVWLDSPEREEAGSPNVAGVVAMAAAIKTINATGYDTLEQVEQTLSRKFLEYLNSRPEISVYGISDTDRIKERLGVFTFNFDNMIHAQAAAILSYEHGIGVRNGCFCSHPFILQLLHVPETTAMEIRTWLKEGNHSSIPGGIRVSFGLYNTEQELDRLIHAMDEIIEGKYSGDYREDPKDGAFHPTSITPEYHRFYTI